MISMTRTKQFCFQKMALSQQVLRNSLSSKTVNRFQQVVKIKQNLKFIKKIKII
jgi:hypothetical protein